jgi:hypothetical protein
MKQTIALCAIAIVVGCSGGSGGGYVPTPAPKIPPAKLTSGQEASLFPMAVGNEWTYEIETITRTKTQQATRKVDAIFRVVKVEKVGDGSRATLDLLSGDKVVDRQVWSINSKGIFQNSIGKDKVRLFSTPIPAIVFPVSEGQKFSWSGTDGKYKMTFNSTVRGSQEVDTAAKRLSAIAVDSLGESVAGKITEKTDRTIWFAPGIGIVRIRESTGSQVGLSEMVLYLKSHKVK